MQGCNSISSREFCLVIYVIPIKKGRTGSIDRQIAKAWNFADRMDTGPGAKGRSKPIQVSTDLSLRQVIAELQGLGKQLERLADAQIETNRILSEEKIQT